MDKKVSLKMAACYNKMFYSSSTPSRGKGGHEGRDDRHSVFEDYGEAVESRNLHARPLPAETSPLLWLALGSS